MDLYFNILLCCAVCMVTDSFVRSLTFIKGIEVFKVFISVHSRAGGVDMR